MIRLTHTGFLFLTLAVLFYFASITSQSGMLLLVIGIFVALLVFNGINARRAVRNVGLFAPPGIHLSEGEKFSQPWKITNRGPRPTGFITVESPAGLLFRVGAVPARSEVSVMPELSFPRRGVHAYSRVTVSSIFPFGLLKARRRLELAGEIVVHPALYPVAAPRARGFDTMVGGKFQGQRRSTSGSNFAGVRPLQAGDALKQIHWKSSAKGQGLMVRVFEEELAGRVGVVLDCGHSGDLKTLDDAVRAAGSLMFAALDAGHHVEWVDLGELSARVVAPFSDGHEILDRLARIEAVPGCLTEEKLTAAVEQLSRRGALHFVLTAANPEVSRVIGRLQNEHRSVTVYLPAGSLVRFDGIEVHYYAADSVLETA